MASGDGLPSVELDLSTFEARHRIDAMRDLNAGLYDTRVSADDISALAMEFRSWRARSLVISTTDHSAASVRRRRLIRRDDWIDNRIMVVIADTAGTRYRNGDRAGHFSPGNIHLVRTDLPLVSEEGGGARRTVGLHFEDAGFDPSRHTLPEMIAAGTPSGRLLTTALRTLTDELPRATAADANALADGFAGMFRALLAPDLRDESTRAHFERGREAALKQFIADNLRNPALGVGLICQSHGVSRATLYRIFEPDGGIAHYVQRLRLEGAMTELAESPPRRGLIGQIAKRWAFADQASFTRSFRARFGCTPGDAAGTASAIPGTPTPTWRPGAAVTPLAKLF